MSKEELDKLYVELFGWLTRDVVVGMYLGVAGAFLVLGLVYVSTRPRAIGLLVITLGLWLLPHAWMWYFAPKMRTGNEVAFFALVISMALTTIFLMWASFKPTARETGQRKALRTVAAGTTLLFLYHAVQYVAVLTLADPPQHWWYWVRFALPVLLLVGAGFVGAGMLMGFIARVRTQAPDRPFQPL